MLSGEETNFNFLVFGLTRPGIESTIYCTRGKHANHYAEWRQTRLEAPWAEPVSLTFQSVLMKLYTEPSIWASYQILVHLATRFQRRRFFRNQPIRNKNCLWWPWLLTDWDEMSIRHRRPSIDASYQFYVHLAKQFQKRRFLEISQSETRIDCVSNVC